MLDKRARALCATIVIALAGVAAGVSAGPGELRSGLERGAPISASMEPADPESLELARAGHLDRSRLILSVLERNPGLRAAEAGLEAARHRPDRVGGLEDPQVSYTFAPLSVASSDERFGQVLSLSQRLPYAGTRRLRRAVAEAEAEMAAENLDSLRLSLANVASLLFDDYYLWARAVEINEEHLGLLDSLKSVATARYAAGVGSQQAPLQAEVEAAHLLHRRRELESDRIALTSSINGLLHRAPDAALPPPPARLPALAPLESSLDSLVERALAERPELRGQRFQQAALESELELARKAFLPDFEVMGTYNSMWRQSEHRAAVGVGIRVPLWKRSLRAAEAEAEAEARAQEFRIEELEDRIRTEIETLRASVAEAEHVIELYASRLLPATDDQVNAALSGFRSGQNDFLAVIDAERSQRRARLGHEQALVDLRQRQAELRRALGRMPITNPGESP